MVTRYHKPDTSPGGIIIPDTSKADPTFSTWEVVCSSPEADDALGFTLGVGDILRTQRRVPIDSGYDTAEGLPVFIMDVEGVFNVIANTWSKHD